MSLSKLKKEKQSLNNERAQACGHVSTYGWDSHPYCISCQIWSQKGCMTGQTDQGVVNLPCISEPYCTLCAHWPKETRELYLSAILERIVDPTKFPRGTKFLKKNGLSAPVELLTILGISCDSMDTKEEPKEGKDLFTRFKTKPLGVHKTQISPTDSESDVDQNPGSHKVRQGSEPESMQGTNQEVGGLPPSSEGQATSVGTAGSMSATAKRDPSGDPFLGVGPATDCISQTESQVLSDFGGNPGMTSVPGALGGLLSLGGTETLGARGPLGSLSTYGMSQTMEGLGAYGSLGVEGSLGPLGEEGTFGGLGPGQFLGTEEVVSSEQGSVAGSTVYDNTVADNLLASTSVAKNIQYNPPKRKHSESVHKVKKAKALETDSREARDTSNPWAPQGTLIPGGPSRTQVTGYPPVPSVNLTPARPLTTAVTAAHTVQQVAAHIAGSIKTARTTVAAVPSVWGTQARLIKASVTGSSRVPSVNGSPSGSKLTSVTRAPLATQVQAGQYLPSTASTAYRADLASSANVYQLPLIRQGTSVQKVPLGYQNPTVSVKDYQDPVDPRQAIILKAKEMDRRAKIARLQAQLQNLQDNSQSEEGSESDQETENQPPSSLPSQLLIEKAVKEYLKLQRIKVAEDSDEEDFPTQNKTWRDFKSTIEVFTDLPQAEPETPRHRTSDMGMIKSKESQKLPLHPLLSETFSLCSESVKRSRDGEPLKVGKLLTTTRNIRKELHTLADVPDFHKAAKDAESDSFLPAIHRKSLTWTEAEVKAQEMQLRELTLLWSQNLWGLQTLDSILDSEAPSQEMLNHIKAVVNQQKMAAPLVQDRITTLLSNVLLKRRDLTLSTFQAKALKEDTIVELRATDFLEDKIIRIPEGIKEIEAEKKSNRDLLSVLRRQTLKVTLPTNFQSQPQPKEDKSASAAAAGASFQVQAQTTQATGFSGAKNYKKQNNAFRGNSFRGNRGRSYNRNYARGRGNSYGNKGASSNSNSQGNRGRGQWRKR